MSSKGASLPSIPQGVKIINIYPARGDDAIKRCLGGWKIAEHLNLTEMGKRMGIARTTVVTRIEDPGTMTIKEFRALIRHANCNEDDIIKMITGGKSR